MTEKESSLLRKFYPKLDHYQRRKTTTAKIGDLYMGSDYPIRVQSMTTTDTMDTDGSVSQIIRMVEAGCELVRLTAPSIKEAQNLDNIKKALIQKGIHVPLVADIHFTPNAAEVAARIVEKVRVNPGNYADKKKFEIIDYNDSEYAEELDRIREKFTPLVRICKEYGTAIRIGTNHGSLSDRIMSRYGDTAHGMVESAMEFLRICEDEGFKNIVLSMKSSNPQVMVQAYRLLVKTMNDNNMYYPLHLGVTEAGDGNDGRIKSALGIGALLEDGIGDTVRVSLTEDPEFEVPVAEKLVKRYSMRTEADMVCNPLDESIVLNHWNPFEFEKRATIETDHIGGTNVPRVFADFSNMSNIEPKDLVEIGHIYDPKLDKWHMTDLGADYIYVGDSTISFMLPMGLKGIYNAELWKTLSDKKNNYPLYQYKDVVNEKVFSNTLNIIAIATDQVDEGITTRLQHVPNPVLLLHAKSSHTVPDLRNAFMQLKYMQSHIPVVIHSETNTADVEGAMLYHSTNTGALLIDGLGDGVMLRDYQLPKRLLNEVSFGILQAARSRITKTEYISCPSCGRTLFDLQETTALIRKHTDHLKGVKIAIMGCIVNGPGEMADADYGYVGSGPGKITLYKGKEVVKKGVNKETAVNELIQLIKDDGNWSEPATSTS
jgi:(E)-4-hydroxy-3-methylbut-2-enyl-diphosphate synthase